MGYLNLLNIQSCYNFLESTIRPHDYVEFLKNQNFNFGFLADYNVMYGIPEFEEQCRANNIKPIIGVSFTISFGQIIVYAKNNEGYKSISTFSSYLQSFDKLDIDQTEKKFFQTLKNNVVVVFVPTVEFIDNYINKLKDHFGKESLFFGVDSSNHHFLKNEENVIFAQEVNFLYDSEYQTFLSLKAIASGELLTDVKNIKKTFYLKQESIANFIDIKKHLSSLDKIVNQVENHVSNDNRKHFLSYPNSKKIPSDNYLRLICEEAFENYQQQIDSKNIYIDRLDMELEVIKKMGFADYFLIVADFIAEAKRKNILVGPGRGSAAGSLVAFLLGITDLDPLKWGLLFERFLNIERITLPDIDIDFQDDRREEVLDYLFEKYGKDHFSTIVTFQTIGIKNAIRDCGRVFNLPIEEVSQMTKQISDRNVKDLQLALDSSETLRKYKEKYPHIFEVVSNIIGLPRQTGTHAAGVVFSDTKLSEVVPTKLGMNGITQTQYSMSYLEEIGLIKTDILGLRNLSIIQEVLKNIRESKNKVIELNKIPENDLETFALLRGGDTSGIFQLESEGMTDVLKKMKVNSIDDIALTSALFRPGPQENIPTFIKRKNNIENNYIIEESLKQILESTYGIIVYQEQVMQILKKVANLSLSKADIIRRAMSKKDHKLMDAFKNEFIEKAVNNNYSMEKAIELWNYIEKFAEYGFNKSHAVAYAKISYWMAYLKTHYKAEFYCALLNGVIRNEIKTFQYINELKASGFFVSHPNIKNPNSVYYFKDNKVMMPLSVIKHIGPEFMRNLKKIYTESKNAFDSLISLLSFLKKYNAIGDQKYNALVYSGAFDTYGYSRKDLISQKEMILNLSDVYGELGDPSITLDIEKRKDNPEEIISYEKEYLGFYISSHPLSILRNKLKNKEKLRLLSSLRGTPVVCETLVILGKMITKKDKNGNEMCFVNIEDESSEMLLTIFASSFETLKGKIKEGQTVILRIKTQFFNNKSSAVFQDLIKIF